MWRYAGALGQSGAVLGFAHAGAPAYDWAAALAVERALPLPAGRP